MEGTAPRLPRVPEAIWRLEKPYRVCPEASKKLNVKRFGFTHEKPRRFIFCPPSETFQNEKSKLRWLAVLGLPKFQQWSPRNGPQNIAAKAIRRSECQRRQPMQATHLTANQSNQCKVMPTRAAQCSPCNKCKGMQNQCS